jgi:hypothetical protein
MLDIQFAQGGFFVKQGTTQMYKHYPADAQFDAGWVVSTAPDIFFWQLVMRIVDILAARRVYTTMCVTCPKTNGLAPEPYVGSLHLTLRGLAEAIGGFMWAGDKWASITNSTTTLCIVNSDKKSSVRCTFSEITGRVMYTRTRNNIVTERETTLSYPIGSRYSPTTSSWITTDAVTHESIAVSIVNQVFVAALEIMEPSLQPPHRRIRPCLRAQHTLMML